MLFPRRWRAGLPGLQLWATLLGVLSVLSLEGAVAENDTQEEMNSMMTKDDLLDTSSWKRTTTEIPRNTNLSTNPSLSSSHPPNFSPSPKITFQSSSLAPGSTESITLNPETSEPETQNLTSTSGVTLTSGTVNSSALSDIPLVTVEPTNLTTINSSSPEETVMTSMPETTSILFSTLATVSTEPLLTSVVPIIMEVDLKAIMGAFTLMLLVRLGCTSWLMYMGRLEAQGKVTCLITQQNKTHIKCLKIKQVQASKGICLELNKTSSCEDFKKTQGANLTKVVCELKVSESEPGIQDCSLILAQSEVNPSCLILVLDSKGDISHMLQVMNKHKSNLEKLGIQDFQEQDIRSHQSYSRKTLIALVTSGLLLAALGTAGYFLMNRRSWSPAGERLGEDPYYTENGGNQGYGAGSGASPDSQEKASQNRGAQENGTSQATSSNGHSSRQHVVADTEL